jgi:hypothetical protein
MLCAIVSLAQELGVIAKHLAQPIERNATAEMACLAHAPMIAVNQRRTPGRS